MLGHRPILSSGENLSKILHTPHSNGARGTGTLAWKTCLPETCAAGKVLKYKVKVLLGGLASAPGLETWSKMYVTFNDLGPAGLETGTYTIDNTAS